MIRAEVAGSAVSLADWIVPYSRSAACESLVERFKRRPDRITDPTATAMLYGIIQHLRPQWSLEIGSLFASSTRIMAEALVDAGIDGKVITLDPFGAERVPRVLQSWPSELQDVTEFRPVSSMDYFLELETMHVPKGLDSPLGVVFVDGHHNFEYALFDIIRSADHITPGGAIVVDNMEQQGPRTAVFQFLKQNAGWQLFWQGKLFTAHNIDRAECRPFWSVLIAPYGLQIGRAHFKLMQRGGLPGGDIGGISFSSNYASHPGVLHVDLNYYAVPYDYHVSGNGLTGARRQASVPVAVDEPEVVVAFDSPLSLDITRSDINVCYELELNFQSDVTDCAYLLLRAQEPIRMIYSAESSF